MVKRLRWGLRYQSEIDIERVTLIGPDLVTVRVDGESLFIVTRDHVPHQCLRQPRSPPIRQIDELGKAHPSLTVKAEADGIGAVPEHITQILAYFHFVLIHWYRSDSSSNRRIRPRPNQPDWSL